MATYSVVLTNTAWSSTLESDVAAQLFVALLRDSLSADLYDATVAGVTYGVTRLAQGLLISAAGFNEKLADVVSVIIDRLNAAAVNGTSLFSERFDNVLEETTQDLMNSEQGWPVRVLRQSMTHLLSNDHNQYSNADRLSELERYESVDDVFVALGGGSISFSNVTMFMHGNVDQQSCKSTASSLQSLLTPTLRVSHVGETFGARHAVMRAGEHVLIQEAGDIEETNGAVIVAHQFGPLSRRDRALLAVTGPVLAEQAFNELRTKQQLGYIASAFVEGVGEASYLVVLVQSSSHTPDDVLRRIESFLFDHVLTWLNAERDQWTTWRAAAINAHAQRPKSYIERASLWFDEILANTYDFRTPETVARDVDLFASLAFEDAFQLIARHLAAESMCRRRATLVRWPLGVVGAVNESDAIHIHDFVAFRRVRGVFNAMPNNTRQLSEEEARNKRSCVAIEMALAAARPSTTTPLAPTTSSSSSSPSSLPPTTLPPSSHGTSSEPTWSPAPEQSAAALCLSDGVSYAIFALLGLFLLSTLALSAYAYVLNKRARYGAYQLTSAMED